MNWGDKTQFFREYAKAYQHAMVFSCLKVAHVAPDQEAKVLDHLQKVAFLLSIACRGHVDIVAQHVQKEGKLYSTFIEPTFTDAKWIHPLIPDEAIADFLQDVYPLEDTDYQLIVYAIDHYLKALTIKSAWPLSAGIFTAMEALKTAFLAKPRESYKYSEWIEWLKQENQWNPRFDQGYPKPEGWKKLRSLKPKLKWMCMYYDIQHTDEELKTFCDRRNDVIHEGTPVPINSSLQTYDDDVNSAWEDICNAISLFERTLLAFLKYNHNSPRELFNQQPTL